MANITCPICGAKKESISIDMSIVYPFVIGDDGRLSPKYTKSDLLTQAQEATDDDMFGFCYNCGEHLKVVTNEDGTIKELLK